jgi:hypothetical protein
MNSKWRTMQNFRRHCELLVGKINKVGSQRLLSFLARSCLGNGKAYRETVLDVKCVRLLCLQRFLETFFAERSIQRVTLHVRAETHVSLRVKRSSLLSDLTEIGMCRRVLVQPPNTEFHEQQMNCSGAVTRFAEDKQVAGRCDKHQVGCEALRSVVLKSVTLWIVTPRRSERSQRFGETYRFHLQGRRASQARNLRSNVKITEYKTQGNRTTVRSAN